MSSRKVEDSVSTESAVSIDGVQKNYRHFQLGPVTGTLKSGWIVGLIGPNGAGKTTLLHILLGLRRASAGTVPDIPFPDIGIVGIGRLPLNETLSGILPIYGDRLDESILLEFLERFQLKAHQKFRNMSSGQQILVQWALALSGRYRLLILDEPFLHVDVRFRSFLYRGLQTFVDGNRIPCLVSSHGLLELDPVVNEIWFLYKGVIKAQLSKPTRKCRWVQSSNGPGMGIGTSAFIRAVERPADEDELMDLNTVFDQLLKSWESEL